MPTKIGFTVVYSTGEDERYRAADLNYHGPTVKGWRSAQFCCYPQEITLQLHSTAILHRIQILAHQYLIPQKIEIWTLEDIEYDETQLFKYLGFITLSDNQATDFKSRELKSVTTPLTVARFVKLRLHANHTNEKNVYSQVGLVAVSVLGELLPNDDFYGDQVNNNGQYDSLVSTDANLISNPQYTSPYDDLAFEMYVDSDVARIMRLMEAKKHQAVIEERFEYASKLKTVLEELKGAGETLGRLEQEKRQAINLEDYDKAKSKKIQIERYRDKVYEELRIEQLLEVDGNYEDNDWSNGHSLTVNNKKGQNTLQEPDLEPSDEPRMAMSPPTRLEADTPSPRHPKYNNEPQFDSRYIQDSPSHARNQNSRSPQLTEPIIRWSPNRPRRTSLTESRRPTSPNHLSHSFSQNAFPVSQNLRSNTPQFQCYTPYTYQEAYTLCSQTSTNELFQSLPPIRPAQPQEERSKIPVVERSKSPTNSNASNVSHSPTNFGIKTLKKKNKPNGLQSKSSYEAYEERMLPALRHPHFHSNDVVRECQLTADQTRKSKLNEREKKLAALPITVYGIELVEKFYSKHFADKEEGLRLLQEQLKAYMNGEAKTEETLQHISPNKLARAAIFLMHRALRDKVYSVYSAAADTVRFFFTEFLPGRLSQAEVARSVEKLLPELIFKSGDVTPRIHNMAAHTLLTMADCKQVRDLHIIPVQLSRPLSSSVHPRLALSRLEMVEQLILNQGISTEKQSGLTCRTLSEFGASGLHHPAEAVRKVSERILVHVYKVNPRLVRKQLPPDDDVTRRNLLYRHLFHEFDLMDTQKREEKTREVEAVKSSTLPKPSKLKLQDTKSDLPAESTNAPEMVKSKSEHAITSQIPKRTVNQQTSPMKPFMPTSFGFCARDENENRLPKPANNVTETCINTTKIPIHVEKTDHVMKARRSMTRISEEVTDSDVVKDKATNDATVHFPNLIDSVHITDKRKPLKYIFPTTYIGNSTTSQETVNKANSTTTFCKMNPELSLGKSHSFPVSGIPIPKNGFNGRGGGLFNSLFASKKYTSRWNKQTDDSGGVKTGSSVTSSNVDVEDVGTEAEGKSYKTCIFCFAKEDWFTEESLNIHYWKNCPMLTRCEHCQEVVEISGLIQHRLDDCEHKEKFVGCSQCKEAVLKEEFNSHECKQTTSGTVKTRCTLCHLDLGKEEWRDHLMGINPCQSHPRHSKEKS